MTFTQKGMLTTENLAPLPPDRDYQLWLMDPECTRAGFGRRFPRERAWERPNRV